MFECSRIRGWFAYSTVVGRWDLGVDCCFDDRCVMLWRLDKSYLLGQNDNNANLPMKKNLTTIATLFKAADVDKLH